MATDSNERKAMQRHTGPDFGDISEDQSPEEIAEQVEAASIRYLDIYARGMSSCDAFGAVAGHVCREYGDYGYRIGQIGANHFVVRHFDGSTFCLFADQYGNVRRLTRDELVETFGADVYGD